MPQPESGEALAELVVGQAGAKPEIRISASDALCALGGTPCAPRHDGRDGCDQSCKTALIFVNTRSQAERTFQELWRINEDNLAIALHHGSLAPDQRRKVEAAMTRGNLRAVVCTSTLDLGIDWGAVDKVICIGAPKGAARLVQRIGRANHRLDEPSRALLVPANRFEVLECNAARDAVMAGELDGERLNVAAGSMCWRSMFSAWPVSAPFDADALYREVKSASPYGHIARGDFDAVVDFVATGGYALKRYDRYARLRKTDEGLWRLAHPRLAQQYRLNVGVIIEEPMVEIRLQSRAVRRAPADAYWVNWKNISSNSFTSGDTFVFSGHVLRFEGMRDDGAYVTKTHDTEAQIPSLQWRQVSALDVPRPARARDGLASGELARAARSGAGMAAHPGMARSVIPQPGQLLVETFPRGSREYLVCYPFEGRLAHQTLGMLLTRRLERLRMRPLGFVANEYALAVWALRDMGGLDMGKLFDEDMLGDDLDAWLAEFNLYKRTFRNCAIIAGLIERRYPGPRENRTAGDVLLRSHLRRACASMSPTTFCCARPMRMPEPDCSTSRGLLRHAEASPEPDRHAAAGARLAAGRAGAA